APGGRLVSSVGGRLAGTVPAHIAAAVVNLTATEPTGTGYASLVPSNATFPPGTSSLNLTPGITIAAGGIVSGAGEFTTPQGVLSAVAAHNGTTGTVHFVLDMAGYFN